MQNEMNIKYRICFIDYWISNHFDFCEHVNDSKNSINQYVTKFCRNNSLFAHMHSIFLMKFDKKFRIWKRQTIKNKTIIEQMLHKIKRFASNHWL